MNTSDAIRKEVHAIRRARRIAWIMSPFAIAFFLFSIRFNFRRALSNIPSDSLSALPADASFEALRLRIMMDCIPMIHGSILMIFSTAMVAVAVILLLPNRKEKLLLLLAEKIDSL